MGTSCSDLGVGSCADGAGAFGAGDSGEQIGLIWNAIQQIAEASLVDHRYILATILQEVGYLHPQVQNCGCFKCYSSDADIPSVLRLR